MRWIWNLCCMSQNDDRKKPRLGKTGAFEQVALNIKQTWEVRKRQRDIILLRICRKNLRIIGGSSCETRAQLRCLGALESGGCVHKIPLSTHESTCPHRQKQEICYPLKHPFHIRCLSLEYAFFILSKFNTIEYIGLVCIECVY